MGAGRTTEVCRARGTTPGSSALRMGGAAGRRQSRFCGQEAACGASLGPADRRWDRWGVGSPERARARTAPPSACASDTEAVSGATAVGRLRPMAAGRRSSWPLSMSPTRSRLRPMRTGVQQRRSSGAARAAALRARDHWLPALRGASAAARPCAPRDQAPASGYRGDDSPAVRISLVV